MYALFPGGTCLTVKMYQLKDRENCKEWEQWGREVFRADKKVVCLTSTGLSDMHASLCSLNLHFSYINSVWREKIPSHIWRLKAETSESFSFFTSSYVKWDSALWALDYREMPLKLSAGWRHEDDVAIFKILRSIILSVKLFFGMRLQGLTHLYFQLYFLTIKNFL